MDSKVICVVLVALGCALLVQAGPMVDNNKGHIDNSVHSNEYSTVEESLMKKLNTKCSSRDVSACMMLKLVTYFNKMLKKSSIEYGDIEITQTSTETVSANSGRSLNVDGMTEESQLSQVIADKFSSFVKTRSLKWKAFDGTDVVISGKSDKDGSLNLGFSLQANPETSNGDARKKKDKGGMGMMMAAAAMKIGLLKALAFKALVLLVGKALLVSKLALVLAVVIGLKKLFSQEKHVTYEVVSHPQHHESHSAPVSSGGGHDSYGGSSGGWGRNFNAQNIAYSAHVPSN